MSWTYWGIVAGIISMVAVFLFAIVTVYARPKRSSLGNKPGVTSKAEPLVQRRAA